jgi:hypothetical protein
VVQFLFGIGLAGSTWALAQSDSPWPVDGKLLGKAEKKSKNVSGIACTSASFPRLCLVIDDDSQRAQVVVLKDGEIRAGDTISLIDDRYEDEKLELDGEGVAFAQGSFYIIGSHGHPRDKDTRLDPVREAAEIEARIKASSQLIRVQIDPATVTAKGKLTSKPEIERSSSLRAILLARPALEPFIDKRLDENGVTIEGVAIHAGRLYAALRAPSLDGHSAILSVTLESLFDNAPPQTRLHSLYLGRDRGFRDLVGYPPGFLALVGPAAGEDGQYSIYWWDGAEQTRLLLDLPRYVDERGEALKPEAILVLDKSASADRILVLFDGGEEGAPRAITVGH